MSVRAVCKFRLRGRPFSGTMDRAVNSTLEKKVQELRNCLNKANFGALISIWKTAENFNSIFCHGKMNKEVMKTKT